MYGLCKDREFTGAVLRANCGEIEGGREGEREGGKERGREGGRKEGGEGGKEGGFHTRGGHSYRQ